MKDIFTYTEVFITSLFFNGYVTHISRQETNIPLITHYYKDICIRGKIKHIVTRISCSTCLGNILLWPQVNWNKERISCFLLRLTVFMLRSYSTLAGANRICSRLADLYTEEGILFSNLIIICMFFSPCGI